MTLANYCISVLGTTGTASSMANELGWTETNENVTFAIDEALELYGVSAEASATDTKKIHSLLKYTLWSQVVNALLNSIDYAADGESFKANQMLQAAERRLADAELDASPYLPVADIDTSSMDFGYDPYLRSR